MSLELPSGKPNAGGFVQRLPVHYLSIDRLSSKLIPDHRATLVEAKPPITSLENGIEKGKHIAIICMHKV